MRWPLKKHICPGDIVFLEAVYSDVDLTDYAGLLVGSHHSNVVGFILCTFSRNEHDIDSHVMVLTKHGVGYAWNNILWVPEIISRIE